MISSKLGDPIKIVRSGEVRLQSPGIKLEADTVWKIFGEISKNYPELNISDVKGDEKNRVFMLSAQSGTGEQKDVVMIRSNSIDIATLEEYEDKVWEKRYINTLSKIAKGLNVMPLSIVHIDSVLIVDWKSSVNHNRILRSALGLENTLGHGFSLMKMLYLNFESRFEVDSTEEIICKIYFESDAKVHQNKVERYPEPLLLRVHCGVAKTGNFGGEASLDGVLSTVYSKATAIFERKVKDGVIEPISRFIAQNEKVKEKTT